MATDSADAGSSALLVQPNRKKNFGFPKLYPFPIVRDSATETSTWNCIIGHLKGQCVEITDEGDIELLFTQGFYGKGTFSRSTPQVLEKKFKERRSLTKSKEKSGEQSKSFLSLSLECEDSNETDDNPAKRRKTDDIEVVLSDTDDSPEDDTSGTSIIPSKEEEKEVLQLSLEEAYFLSYAFGVLVVKDKDQPLDLMRLWHKCCEIHPSQNFPVMYTAYHHFRSKGWIVRSGIRYGSDFILYKDGPPFYHASYAVVVKPVKEQNLRDIPVGNRPNFTWSSLAALHRICNHASKGLLILYVIKPTSISENKISTPFCVSQYQVEEVLVNRWVPSEEQRFES